MTTQTSYDFIKGISVCNPVDIDPDYLMYTVDYAIKNNYNHIQVIGPIHDYVKGNIDGMTFYRKYSHFNNEKNKDYVALSMQAVNEACKKAKTHGLKTYMWHHELYLPKDFKAVYPQILNDLGDVEVSHPLVQDFLEHKIIDFFHAYSDMDGIILTLHETSIPILKLRNQKLDKIARVKHVTKILYDTCCSLGKTLIVRPFASLEEDYAMMTKAYEEISTDLLIMDKWTQFDWSLTMPSNPFFNKIQNNPLFVEADIFGEYFGKGRLPLMLADHIKQKFDYCSKFNPAGYVARIDRNGQIPFNDVNEVNLEIMNAYLDGRDPQPVIEAFFERKYPQAAKEVMSLMEQTEAILINTIYINSYLFSQLSIFPNLNHSKNHYYFEMMRDNYCIDSNEWYIPKNWIRPSLEVMLSQKEEAAGAAEQLFHRLEILQDKIEEKEYRKIWIKFYNLKQVTRAWLYLTQAFIHYVKYFETRDEVYEKLLNQTLEDLNTLSEQGKALLGDKFYCNTGNQGQHDYVEDFIREIRESFILEKQVIEAMDAKKAKGEVVDYVICGGGMEGHHLQKEVNFSDVLVYNGALCRIPGNSKGAAWSAINAHGWFSYLISIQPNTANTIKITMENPDGELSCIVTIDDKEHVISRKATGPQELLFHYNETEGNSSVRIRIDRNSCHIPYVYNIQISARA